MDILQEVIPQLGGWVGPNNPSS